MRGEVLPASNGLRVQFYEEGNAAWKARTVAFDLLIYGDGTCANAEVVQMLTPAGLRDEHPLATIISSCITRTSTFEDIRRMCRYLAVCMGKFELFTITPAGDRALYICVGSKPRIVLRPNGGLEFFSSSVPKASEQGTVVLFSKAGDGVEFIEIPITRPTESRMFVTTVADRLWCRELAGLHDEVYDAYAKEITNTHWEPLFYSRVVAESVEHALTINANVRAIVINPSPVRVSMSAMAALVRQTWETSSNRYLLEAPIYESALRSKLSKLR